MKNQIIINGKISAILTKDYQGVKTTNVQFLMESDFKGLEIIKVKITKEEDIGRLTKDMIVSIPVTISSMNNNIYYSQSDSVQINMNNNTNNNKEVTK